MFSSLIQNLWNGSYQKSSHVVVFWLVSTSLFSIIWILFKVIRYLSDIFSLPAFPNYFPLFIIVWFFFQGILTLWGTWIIDRCWMRGLILGFLSSFALEEAIFQKSVVVNLIKVRDLVYHLDRLKNLRGS